MKKRIIDLLWGTFFIVSSVYAVRGENHILYEIVNKSLVYIVVKTTSKQKGNARNKITNLNDP